MLLLFPLFRLIAVRDILTDVSLFEAVLMPICLVFMVEQPGKTQKLKAFWGGRWRGLWTGSLP
jgi:hypothetical protein